VTDAAVRIENVSKSFRLYSEKNTSLKSAMLRGGRARYEVFPALHDVSLEIPRGSTFALIGANGSGKSTLLKCIARILRPETGKITVAGKMSALLELGAGFHPDLSGRENVFLNASILGLSRKQVVQRFDEIVQFAGLERFIDSPVKNYSSGMYVRLGFAVAINVDPEVLLVDEVLAVGDESFQQKCNERFAYLREIGTTIVVVSHSLGVVRTLCEQAAWLESGVVRDLGPTSRIIDEYVEVMHPERVAVRDAETGEATGHRWGEGGARIERVEILAANGRATRRVRMGESATFRLHYACDEPVKRPVFGLGVHRLDGVHVTGINSRETCVPREISGRGHMDFSTDALPILPGTYDVTVALMDYSNLRVYDHWNHAHRFDIAPGLPKECQGVIAMAGTWRVGDEPKGGRR
jgi:ABC-2 type transport system ATP-binding protein